MSIPATLALGSPLVSVIVPCFREGRFLDDCLWSLRRQHHRHLDIIVIDDAGDDDSIAVALDHAAGDDRIRVMRTHSNLGLGAVRNVALDHSRGELVTFVDGDDLLPPRAISARVAALARAVHDAAPEDRDRIVGVYGDWRYVTAAVVEAPRADTSRPLVAMDLAASAGGNVFIVSAPLVRTDALRESGGFATDVAGGEDYIAWMRLLARGGVFVPCQEVVAAYRQKPASMVRSSADEYAALASAGRAWVDEALAGLDGPSAAWPELEDLAAGEHTIEFGSIVDRAPTIGASPATPPDGSAWPTSAPTGPRAASPTAARIAHGTALLRGTPERPNPKIDTIGRIGRGVVASRFAIAAIPPRVARRNAPVEPAPLVAVHADSFYGGMVAASIAVLAPEAAISSLVLSPSARSGALRLLVRIGLPDGLHLVSAHRGRRDREGRSLATIVTPRSEIAVGLGTNLDARALVAAAVGDHSSSESEAIGSGVVLVMAPGGGDPIAWFERALDLGTEIGGGRAPTPAACDSRTARRCDDAGISVSVVTIAMVIAAGPMVTDDPDVALLAASLDRPVVGSDGQSPLIPPMEQARADVMAALASLLRDEGVEVDPRHSHSGPTR